MTATKRKDETATLNDMYHVYMKIKAGIKATTRGNYTYMYEHFVMNDLGRENITGIRYSNVRLYYNKLVDRNFIFSNRFNAVYIPETINRAIRRIVEAHNRQEREQAAKEHREAFIIPSFSVHQLRHTFCTRFCEHETNVKVIQEIMGHKDIKTTMNIYAEVTTEKKRQTMENLEGKFRIS